MFACVCVYACMYVMLWYSMLCYSMFCFVMLSYVCTYACMYCIVVLRCVALHCLVLYDMAWHSMFVCLSVCMFVFIHVFMYLYFFVQMYLSIYVFMYTYKQIDLRSSCVSCKPSRQECGCHWWSLDVHHHWRGSYPGFLPRSVWTPKLCGCRKRWCGLIQELVWDVNGMCGKAESTQIASTATLKLNYMYIYIFAICVCMYIDMCAAPCSWSPPPCYCTPTDNYC